MRRDTERERERSVSQDKWKKEKERERDDDETIQVMYSRHYCAATQKIHFRTWSKQSPKDIHTHRVQKHGQKEKHTSEYKVKHPGTHTHTHTYTHGQEKGATNMNWMASKLDWHELPPATSPPPVTPSLRERILFFPLTQSTGQLFHLGQSLFTACNNQLASPSAAATPRKELKCQMSSEALFTLNKTASAKLPSLGSIVMVHVLTGHLSLRNLSWPSGTSLVLQE